MGRGIKKSKGEKIFNMLNIMLMIFLVFIMLYPFWHILMYSISDQKYAATGGFFFWPRHFNLDTYKFVFSNKSIYSGFKVSFIVTFVGTVLSVFFTATTAYPLSKKHLKGKTFFTFMIFFTMLFGGGLIPTFVLIKGLKLYNHLPALFLPGMISAWNFFIMRNFFAALPDSLEESAKIDGASDIQIFFKIVLPLSKAVLATVALFVAVGYWNDFFSSVIYIKDKDKWSLQAVLRQLIGQTSTAMSQAGVSVAEETAVSSQSFVMATIIIVTTPIVIIYPFLQKYFVKGVMVGSIKG